MDRAFRFPTLISAPENSHGSIQFIYKMPWLLYVEYESAEIDRQVQLTVNVESINNNRLVLCGTPNYTTEPESTTMSSNS
jgi:hypothetical protein